MEKREGERGGTHLRRRVAVVSSLLAALTLIPTRDRQRSRAPRTPIPLHATYQRGVGTRPTLGLAWWTAASSGALAR